MLTEFANTPHSALLVVDVQNDFCSSGSMAVPDADAIIPELNDFIKHAEKHNIPVIYSRDWHPKQHCSFKNNGGPWPEHCVQNTWGASFHPNLQVSDNTMLVNKANTNELECYSALSGREVHSNELLYRLLRDAGIKHIWITGLALDYCVFSSAEEAIQRGFTVSVILPLCRSIDAAYGEQVITKLLSMGATIYRETN